MGVQGRRKRGGRQLPWGLGRDRGPFAWGDTHLVACYVRTWARKICHQAVEAQALVSSMHIDLPVGLPGAEEESPFSGSGVGCGTVQSVGRLRARVVAPLAWEMVSFLVGDAMCRDVLPRDAKQLEGVDVVTTRLLVSELRNGGDGYLREGPDEGGAETASNVGYFGDMGEGSHPDASSRSGVGVTEGDGSGADAGEGIAESHCEQDVLGQ